MATAAAHEIINCYAVGAVGHYLSADDGELYYGEIVGVVHDQTNSTYKVFLTLATESGFVTVRVH